MCAGRILASEPEPATALVTDIQGYSIHDGPGIRTVVFLKGCGLRCWWCSNPECISPSPEIGLVRNLCTKCGECAPACREGALSWAARELPRVDRARCTGCGTCAQACSYKALVLYGKRLSVDEVFIAVARDRMFYDSSGGGVTLSGGEPLLQPGFAGALFERCHEAGIDTCLETSGCAPTAALREVLPHTDHVLFDLKLHDGAAHRRYAGRSNRLILENAALAAASGADVLFRMPLVPGINDGQEHVEATASFIRRLQGATSAVQLMPYHRLGKGKYESLDRPYRLSDLVAPAPDQVERVREIFTASGVECTVSE
jgi:pyruvate formate lyase activating enzyme